PRSRGRGGPQLARLHEARPSTWDSEAPIGRSTVSWPAAFAPAAAHTPPPARAQPRPRPARTGGESLSLLDDLGGLHQHLLRDGEAQRLRRLEVDHEVEGRGLLDREIG